MHFSAVLNTMIWNVPLWLFGILMELVHTISKNVI